MLSEPAAVSWGPNHLDVFYEGGDHTLWHRKWDGSRWLPEEGLGGEMKSAPTVVAYAPNHIDVFYKGREDALWHRVFDNG